MHKSQNHKIGSYVLRLDRSNWIDIDFNQEMVLIFSDTWWIKENAVLS